MNSKPNRVFDRYQTGLYMKELRSRYNLSQTEVADVLGITRSQLSNIEAGKNIMTIPNYFQLSDFYRSLGANISIIDLMTGVELPKKDVEQLEQRLKQAESKAESMNDRCLELEKTINRLVEQLSAARGKN